MPPEKGHGKVVNHDSLPMGSTTMLGGDLVATQSEYFNGSPWKDFT